jgi:hypothetical protein
LTPPDPPLAGRVVLSVGHTLPGLIGLALLRDLGAEVLRVERPRGTGGAGPYAELGAAFPSRSLLAGTSELALDLKSEEGRAAFLRLAAAADALLEGFRPGVAARLGIDAEAVCAAHPKLVYAALSGYGQEGPMSQRAGHDVNYLAETGVLGLAAPRGLPGATFADGLAVRQRGPDELESALWQDAGAPLPALLGESVSRGLRRRALPCLPGQAPGAPLPAALGDLPPAALQCVGSDCDPWAAPAASDPSLVVAGGLVDSCWMWRTDGPLARARERDR